MATPAEQSHRPTDSSAPSKAQILIVDDHALLRSGLRQLIESEMCWEVCGEAASSQEAMQHFRDATPDLVIVDIALENSDGLDLVRRIRDTGAPSPVLVLSMYNEKLYAERALRAGADGFVNKQQPSHEISEAIRTVLAGEVYLSKRMSLALFRRAAKRNSELESSPVELLSDREMEIFRLIGQGLNTHDIARQLHLSPNTVGTYRERLKTKLNATSAADLNRMAMHWMLENG